MWRILFFFMGVPMMIMSLFEAVDALPYATDYNVLVDGQKIELTVDQKSELEEKIVELFTNCHTMPAFGVVTPEIFDKQIKEGTFVSIKFDKEYMLNELPFDELVFEVGKDFYGFNLLRGQKGVFQGRCIYLSVIEGDMDELYDYITSIIPTIEAPSISEEVVEEQPNIEEKISE